MEGQSIISNRLRFIESKKILKISSQDVPITAGCKLITAANNHGMIIVGSQEDNSIRAIPFNLLMDFNQSQSKSEIINFNQFKFVTKLNFRPNILTVARHGFSSVLLVIGQSILEAFDLDTQTSLGQTQLNSADVIDYAWHPNYFDSIVALCTKNGELLVISISRRDRQVFVVYNSQQYAALSCCWSPKGKNLAIGMADGRVKRLEPILSASSFTFKDVDKSLITFTNPKITPQHRLIRLRWISKTHLLGIHARPQNPAGPETVYSMFTVKPSAPYRYWTSICFESQNVPEQIYYVANMTDAAVCGSIASGEATVIGLDGEEWKTIIIDEEGARIELPLDSRNTETFPRGLAVACLDKQPVLVFYTSASVICSYATTDPSHKVPSLQPAIDSPLTQQAAIRQPMMQQQSFLTQTIPLQQQQQPLTMQGPQSTQSISALLQQASLQQQQQPLSLQQPTLQQPQPRSQQQLQQPILQLQQPTLQPRAQQPQQSQQATPPQHQQPHQPSQSQPTPQHQQQQQSPLQTKQPTTPQAPTVPQPQVVQKMMQQLALDIASMKVEKLPALDGVNVIRRELEEIEDIHKVHREATEAIAKDIETLDTGMLENLYLIEYIKTHSKKQTKKRYLDPATQKKVESIRSKVEAISHKLRDANNHVDIDWTLYQSKKSNKLDSLEMIYKTLATHQKIISTLKKKVSVLKPSKIDPADESHHKSMNESVVPTKELNLARLGAFREFLASRDTVPVRRPE